MRYIHTTEYYSVVKRDEVLIHATEGMNLGNIITEWDRKQKSTYGNSHLYETSRIGVRVANGFEEEE